MWLIYAIREKFQVPGHFETNIYKSMSLKGFLPLDVTKTSGRGKITILNRWREETEKKIIGTRENTARYMYRENVMGNCGKSVSQGYTNYTRKTNARTTIIHHFYTLSFSFRTNTEEASSSAFGWKLCDKRNILHGKITFMVFSSTNFSETGNSWKN